MLVEDRINTMEEKPKIKCLSFFSGAMGLDIGLDKAGITPLLASEIDPSARETIATNCPLIGLIGDMTQYSPEEILRYAGLPPNAEIDVMVGGPPCQAFSTAGKRKGFEDSRGNLLLSYVDLILRIKPKVAVIENVRGLLSAKDGDGSRGSALLYVLRLLQKGGYGVSFNLYNAANFGAPQIRERVVLLCSRDGEEMPWLVPTNSENGEFGLPGWKTLREALLGLPGSDCQHFVKFPEKRLKYYRMLGEGQNWKSLPENLQKEALGGAYSAQGGKVGFYRRLSWGRPSPTLVTHPAMPATDLCHPKENRPLSVEEYRRIQGFPDNWALCGKLLDQYKQLGNAVPVKLGEAIGVAVLNYLKGEKAEPPTGFKYSRYNESDHISWRSALNRIKLKEKKLSLLDI